MAKKTYLTIMFSSEGANISQITKLVVNLGFTPIKGSYDFVYKWEKKPSIRKLINLSNRVQKTLRGKKVLFQISTP